MLRNSENGLGLDLHRSVDEAMRRKHRFQHCEVSPQASHLPPVGGVWVSQLSLRLSFLLMVETLSDSFLSLQEHPVVKAVCSRTVHFQRRCQL